MEGVFFRIDPDIWTIDVHKNGRDRMDPGHVALCDELCAQFACGVWNKTPH